MLSVCDGDTFEAFFQIEGRRLSIWSAFGDIGIQWNNVQRVDGPERFGSSIFP
jgi:hypothetical protein